MGISMNEFSLHQLLIQHNKRVLCIKKIQTLILRNNIKILNTKQGGKSRFFFFFYCQGLGSKRDASGTLDLGLAARIQQLAAEKGPASTRGIWARALSCTGPGSPSPLSSSSLPLRFRSPPARPLTTGDWTRGVKWSNDLIFWGHLSEVATAQARNVLFNGLGLALYYGRPMVDSFC